MKLSKGLLLLVLSGSSCVPDDSHVTGTASFTLAGSLLTYSVNVGCVQTSGEMDAGAMVVIPLISTFRFR